MARRKKIERAEGVTDLSDKHLACRAWEHQWDQVNDLGLVTGEDGTVVEFTRLSQCMRCDTKRRSTYAVPSMKCIRTKYEYPDYYLVAKGTSTPGRTTAGAGKFEFLSRNVRRRSVDE